MVVAIVELLEGLLIASADAPDEIRIIVCLADRPRVTTTWIIIHRTLCLWGGVGAARPLGSGRHMNLCSSTFIL